MKKLIVSLSLILSVNVFADNESLWQDLKKDVVEDWNAVEKGASEAKDYVEKKYDAAKKDTEDFFSKDHREEIKHKVESDYDAAKKDVEHRYDEAKDYVKEKYDAGKKDVEGWWDKFTDWLKNLF